MREERAVERSTPPHLKQKTRLHRLQGERERWNRVRAVDKLELGLGLAWGSHQCMASHPESFGELDVARKVLGVAGVGRGAAAGR